MAKKVTGSAETVLLPQQTDNGTDDNLVPVVAVAGIGSKASKETCISVLLGLCFFCAFPYLLAEKRRMSRL